MKNEESKKLLSWHEYYQEPELYRDHWRDNHAIKNALILFDDDSKNPFSPEDYDKGPNDEVEEGPHPGSDDWVKDEDGEDKDENLKKKKEPEEKSINYMP